MKTRILELETLNDYLRSADMLQGHHVLNKKYREAYLTSWDVDLYKNGNELSNEKLNLIARCGLARWYIQNFIPFSINYDFKKNVTLFINDQSKIDYFNFRKIFEYYLFKTNKNFDENIIFSPFSTNKAGYLEQLRYFDSSKIDKLYSEPFYKTLETFSKTGELLNMLREVKHFLEIEPLINETTVFSNIYKIYPELTKYGILYYRYKVVLEKISNPKNGYPQETILCINKFVENVQRVIYTIIFKHFELNNFKNINTKIVIEHPIIELLEKKILLEPIPNNQILGARKLTFDYLYCVLETKYS